MKPKFTKKEILDFFYSLSLEEVIKIVKDYDNIRTEISCKIHLYRIIGHR